MGEWDKATAGLPAHDVYCPRCAEDRHIERIGLEYFCRKCANRWRVLDRAVAMKESE